MATRGTGSRLRLPDLVWQALWVIEASVVDSFPLGKDKNRTCTHGAGQAKHRNVPTFQGHHRSRMPRLQPRMVTRLESSPKYNMLACLGGVAPRESGTFTRPNR